MLRQNTLDVTILEPRQKHPTIFARFDQLTEGEDLTIVNDHDPKPLYYQLLGERGDIFTWEYLEQGPEWWRVRIAKKSTGSETLGQIAAKDLRKAKIFKKYGLDFCCGGKKTVRQACEEKGLDTTRIERELQQVDQVRDAGAIPYDQWDPAFLADYIVNTHHAYVKKNLPDILTYAQKVLRVHGSRHPELLALCQGVEQVAVELTDHLEKEENFLFPYIKTLSAAAKGNTPRVEPPAGALANPIHRMEIEHESVGNYLAAIRTLTKDYTLPEDACATYTLLYGMLDEFENDLHLHVHLENNILFPKALEWEQQL
ncbi:MAG TPA: iron-sulfur cluster repair di-iron protein [Puia sp.]|uniref:iron-sulfur cluster repair di-iron protein n=1 Tax=Puia sp. TaxID=2045100 RepID=UPI002C2C03B1|nr:iron-sulfur cluster repair di-iron protein [Puia sp.]HVU94323.1 iron-sulfur cluster repair di-iron protein [Puia sp.]